MNDFFQNKYRIPSARAQWHDYYDGIYFVTICTAKREHFFGDIVDVDNERKMQLSEIGRFATENFQNVQIHYPYAEIPLFVVMPNHIHAFVILDENNNDTRPNCRDVARNVSTDGGKIQGDDETKNEFMSNISPKYGSLPIVIRGLKSAITKFANENDIPFSWQSRFYDRIVRDSIELNQIADYIENNVAKWENDEFYI